MADRVCGHLQTIVSIYFILSFDKVYTDVWATAIGRLNDRHRDVWTTKMKNSRRSRVYKRLSVFSCFRTHLSKVHRCSKNDLQRH